MENFIFCAVRIKQMLETFILSEDHKKIFPNSTSFRMINRLMSEIGEISTNILDNTNE